MVRLWPEDWTGVRVGRGRTERPARPGRCSGCPRAQRPHGRALGAPRRAGRYPTAAEPPPASAPADWRSRSPARHCWARSLARSLLSPPLGRAPRCRCSSGPWRRGRFLSSLQRDREAPARTAVARATVADSVQRGSGLAASPGPPPARRGRRRRQLQPCGSSPKSRGPEPGQVPPRSRWASAPPDELPAGRRPCAPHPCLGRPYRSRREGRGGAGATAVGEDRRTALWAQILEEARTAARLRGAEALPTPPHPRGTTPAF